MTTKLNKNQENKKPKNNNEEKVLVGVITENNAVELKNPKKFNSLEDLREYSRKIQNLCAQHEKLKSNLDFLKVVANNSLEASKLASENPNYGIIVMDLNLVEELKRSGKLGNNYTLIKKQEVVHQFSVFVSGVLAKYASEIEEELLNE